MKIAVSVWEGRVSPVFDTASRLLVLDMEGEREQSNFEMYLDDQTLTRKCSRIQVLGVDVLICGAISRYFQGILTSSGIRVIPWVCGSKKEVVEAYMEGNLLHSRFLMPGCSRKRGERCRKGTAFQKNRDGMRD